MQTENPLPVRDAEEQMVLVDADDRVSARRESSRCIELAPFTVPFRRHLGLGPAASSSRSEARGKYHRAGSGQMRVAATRAPARTSVRLRSAASKKRWASLAPSRASAPSSSARNSTPACWSTSWFMCSAGLTKALSRPKGRSRETIAGRAWKICATYRRGAESVQRLVPAICRRAMAHGARRAGGLGHIAAHALCGCGSRQAAQCRESQGAQNTSESVRPSAEAPVRVKRHYSSRAGPEQAASNGIFEKQGRAFPEGGTSLTQRHGE